MLNIRRLVLFLLAFAFLLSVFAVAASAQIRRHVRPNRVNSGPVVVWRQYVVRDPFWYDRYRWRYWGDPFWSDPYWSDPYLREQRERYYRQKAVRDSRRKIAKKRAKYLKDGYLSMEEREKLAKYSRNYSKAVARLNKFNREY